MEGVTINREQELYVIPCGDGFTCLGFDVLIRKANAVAAWLENFGFRFMYVPDAWRGTMPAYKLYTDIMEAAGEFSKRSGHRCPAELIPEFIGREGRRVEVVDKYGETRRFVIGKSCGWMPCHLELKNKRSSSGGAVSGYPFKSLRFLKERAAR